MKRNDACLIQIACGDQARLMELTMARHAEYCAAHNIDYRLTIGAQTSQSCFIEQWFAAIGEVLNEGYESVIFLDADTCIVGDTDLREACEWDTFAATWHDNPDWEDDRLYDHYNLGCFYIGNGECVIDWFKVWRQRDFSQHPWAQQHEFNLMARKSVGEFVRKLPHAWNSTPNYPDPNPIVLAWHGYGNMAQRYDAMKEAIGEGESQARTVTVSSPEETIAKAQYYEATGQNDEAEALYRFCLQFDPNNVEIMKRVGCLLNARQEWAEALTFFEKVVEIAPDDGDAWRLVGGTCDYVGLSDQAYTASKKAVELIPGNAAAHVNHGITLLRHGEWARGFENMEWQIVSRDRHVRHPWPIWNGKFVETLLVYAEQGYGDAIMLWQLLQRVLDERLVKWIILEVPTPIASLFQDQCPRIKVIERQTDGRISCFFDAHIGMMSLARVLHITTDTLGWQGFVRPIHASGKKTGEWGRKLTGDGLRVGICWAGSRGHANDRNRSIPPALFDDLAHTPGCSFVSLQVGADIPQEVRDSTPEVQFIGDELKDFADTAAVIANLDLVITVDTSVAHLAGAMGKPVFILLSKSSDWRWLMDRDDSVWYGSATLFRQETLGDWSGPLARVQLELEKMRDENA